YLNQFLAVTVGWEVPKFLSHDPFSVPGAWFNLPAVLILLAVTAVLVIGIRESAASNTALVVIKIGVVLFVIVVGWSFVDPANWTESPVEDRKVREQRAIPDLAAELATDEAGMRKAARSWAAWYAKKEVEDDTPVEVTVFVNGQRMLKLANEDIDIAQRAEAIEKQTIALLHYRNAEASGDAQRLAAVMQRVGGDLPETRRDREVAEAILAKAREQGPIEARKSWGLLAYLGIDDALARLDEATRTR